jgi:branched-subunit amino acid transport protein
MATSYGPAAILGVIVVVGVLTYAIRVSFFALFGRVDEVPRTVERALRFVPAAVLAALVVPAVVAADAGAGGVPVDRVVAAGLAGVVAWRTEDVLATMVVGMGALWAVRLLL